MLRTIIKRSGEKEPYDPVKLQKWVIWAAKHIRARVDWAKIITNTVKAIKGEEIGSQELQKELIKQLVRAKRWPEALMAGRLYAALTHKELYEDRTPTVRKLQARLAGLNLMSKLPYSDEDYAEIEKLIQHDRDFHMSYAQVRQVRKKYAIQNTVKGIEYETPQFVFMRMAMKLSQNIAPEKRLDQVKSFYEDLSHSRMNAPSPNYLNLGTPLNGLASCCLIASDDDDESLAIGDYIARKMTVKSAGIGTTMMTRSVGDPVRGGRIRHLGKMGYYKSLAATVKSSIQAGRGGALTTYFNIFDPENETIIQAQNPRTVEDKRNRDLHFAWQDNRFFALKVMRNEDVFLFNIRTAPDLFWAMYSEDQPKFDELYAKYEADPKFEKTYVNARDLLIKAYGQRNEVATLYRMQVDEVNRHTSFVEKILSSNLCAEITQVTYPYYEMIHLLTKAAHGFVKFTDTEGIEHHVDYSRKVKIIRDDKAFVSFMGNVLAGDVVNNSVHIQSVEEVRQESEISTCSLGGIVITNIENDEQYEEAAYNNLLMIDECIDLTEYAFPHLEFTAKARRNAGVGILGLAYHMARKGLKYDTPEGLKEIHRVSERHMYFLIKAAIRITRERGVCDWAHKTKWANGWLPIDTYKKTVDELVPHELDYDWEPLRVEIIKLGGLHFSSLCAHMPTESSSKASGAPNSVYPVRDLSLKKTDVGNALEWVAPDNDILEDEYQLAWEISPVDQAKFYAVIQKFTDQSISADFYRDRTKKIINEQGQEVVAPLTDDELILEYQACTKYGVKTQYYNNSFTGGKKIDKIELKTTPAVIVAHTEIVVNAPDVKVIMKSEAPNPDHKVIVVEADSHLATHTEDAKPAEPERATDSLDELDGDGQGVGCAGGFCTL